MSNPMVPTRKTYRRVIADEEFRRSMRRHNRKRVLRCDQCHAEIEPGTQVEWEDLVFCASCGGES